MAKKNEGTAGPVKVKKSECPITREQFKAAKPIRIIIQQPKGDSSTEFETIELVDIPAKQMSTGSLGWHIAQKVSVKVDGVNCKVQCNLMGILVGSKELPQE